MSENKKVIKSLTPLKTQMENAGQTHSFADPKKIWKFMKPISLIDLIETYKEVLTNVVMELKGLKEPLPKSSRDGFFNRR